MTRAEFIEKNKHLFWHIKKDKSSRHWKRSFGGVYFQLRYLRRCKGTYQNNWFPRIKNSLRRHYRSKNWDLYAGNV